MRCATRPATTCAGCARACCSPRRPGPSPASSRRTPTRPAATWSASIVGAGRRLGRRGGHRPAAPARPRRLRAVAGPAGATGGRQPGRPGLRPEPGRRVMADRMRRLLAVAVVAAAIVAVGLHTRQPQASAEDRQAVLAPVRLHPAGRQLRTRLGSAGPAGGPGAGRHPAVDLGGRRRRGADRPARAGPAGRRCAWSTRATTRCGSRRCRAAGSPAYPAVQLLPDRACPTTRTMAPMGCVPADVNSDGAGDVIVFYWGRSPVLFLNQGVHDGVPTRRRLHRRRAGQRRTRCGTPPRSTSATWTAPGGCR